MITRAFLFNAIQVVNQTRVGILGASGGEIFFIPETFILFFLAPDYPVAIACYASRDLLLLAFAVQRSLLSHVPAFASLLSSLLSARAT